MPAKFSAFLGTNNIKGAGSAVTDEAALAGLAGGLKVSIQAPVMEAGRTEQQKEQ
jgi:hypothetical protein